MHISDGDKNDVNTVGLGIYPMVGNGLFGYYSDESSIVHGYVSSLLPL